MLILKSNEYSSLDDIDSNIIVAVTPYPTITNTNENTNIENPMITPTSSGNIEVVSPHVGDAVKKDILVKGNARTSENKVAIRLWDSSGNLITETTAETNASSKNQYGSFEKLIAFKTSDEYGELEIFQYNTEDGSITDTVEIPLNFNQ